MNSPAPDVLFVGPLHGPAPRLLARQGYAVDVEETLLSAMFRPPARTPRLLLLSARTVPRREIEALRALKALPRPPLVILARPPSATPTEEELRRSGADDLLSEPYLPDDLLERVRRLLEPPVAEPPPAGALPAPAAPGPVSPDLLADLADLQRGPPRIRKIVDRLVAIVARRTGALRISVMLYHASRRELVIRRAVKLPPGPTIDTDKPIGQGLAGHAAAHGFPLLIPDVANSPYGRYANRGPYSTDSCLIIPLLDGRQLIGILNLADKQSGAPFTTEDLEALLPLAEQAARSLRTALHIGRLTSLSMLDGLTGLLNQRGLQVIGNSEFLRARRHHRSLAVAYIDLDRFKAVNDLHGHACGDRALRAFARVLKQTFRESDSIIRRGGDEFAVFLPELTGEPARPIFERLRENLLQTPVEGIDPASGFRLTFSAGVAFYPADARDLDALLEAADRALYAAKARGRDRTVLWSELAPPEDKPPAA